MPWIFALLCLFVMLSPAIVPLGFMVIAACTRPTSCRSPRPECRPQAKRCTAQQDADASDCQTAEADCPAPI